MPLGSFNATIVNTAGDVVPNAQVQVRRTSDNGLATLFSNAAGDAKANPFNADANTAFAQFFAERGTYTVAASTGSGTVTWTVDVVSAFEPPLTREIANGSATAPSIAFASDSNTGLYRIGADQLGLAEGGVDRGRLYARRNILGTVSQTAGVPTGAGFESGANANGTYVRFADGTLICTHNVTLSGGENTTISGTWTFPSAYSVSPVVTFGATSPPPNGTRARALWQDTGTTVRALKASIAVDWPANTSEPFSAMAIGRWF